MEYSLKRNGHHEWLCKTNFSFLVGASHPHEVIKRASDLGYGSLAINDFDGVYGLARAHLDLREKVRSSLKLNYGAEVHLRDDHDRSLLLQETISLMALDHTGYRNLCDLLTFIHRDKKQSVFLGVGDLSSLSLEGLVAVKPMRGKIREGGDEHLGKLKEIFKENLFLAVSRHLNESEDHCIRKRIQDAKSFQIKTLLCQDVFFHERKRKGLSDILAAVKSNRVVSDCEEFFFPNGHRCFHDLNYLDCLYRPLSIYTDSVKSSLELNERMNFSLDQLSYKYPGEMIPEGYSSQRFLEKLVYEGLMKRLGENYSQNLRNSVDRELKLIRNLKFADYFLTVWDIVNFARSQEILCQGRGSAANSIICFALGITSVNPNEFELLFERFLSEERGDPPDIDVDFEHERREEVIQYIYARYGRTRAAMVANVITYKQKGSMRAVGKALGVPEVLLKKASEKKGVRLFRGQDISFYLESLKEDFKDTPFDIQWDYWMKFSSALCGFPRHLGIHSGGFVISGESLSELVPVEPATMEGRTVIQWCKDDIEGLGFFKIDMLALGMLSSLRKSFKLIESHYGVKLGLYEIPENDEKTYQMIQKADTVGTFQIESRAQMTMLPRLKPKCFYDLVVEVAIIRPGPLQGKVVHPYLRRRDGVDPIIFPAPCLEPILKRTLGIAIFQEQAMRIAVEVGNFTPGEADQLRKNIGSWNSRDFEQNLAPWLEKLEQGMRSKGFDDYFVEQILGQMKGFSDYGFPESHAISFALIAYASAYLKAHFPAAFFVGLLNSQPMGFYTPHQLIKTAIKDGVKVLPPCINKSYLESKLEKVNDQQYGIRLGFHLVNDLSAKVGTLIEDERREGFFSYEDFLRRVNCGRDELAALAAANVFSCFKESRSDALWKSDFGKRNPLLEKKEQKGRWKSEQKMERVLKDFSSFNTSLADHPVRLIKSEIWDYSIPVSQLISAKNLEKVEKVCEVNVFGMVSMKQSPPTAKGMVFITLEDEGGFFNLVFRPDKYATFWDLIEYERFLCVNGVLQRAGQYRSILVNTVYQKKEHVAEIIDLEKEERNEGSFGKVRQYY